MPEPSQGFSPAGRLFRLLQYGIAQNQNQTTLEVWAAILGIDPQDKAAIFAGFGDVVQLISDARDHVRAHPELKQSLYLGTLSTIESVLLAPTTQGQWGNIATGLSGPHMMALEFCAEQMDRLALEQELPLEMLDSLRADIEAALTRLLNSDLSHEVKAHLAARLEDLRAAILRYRVSGVSAIARATEASLGAAIVAQTHAQGEKPRAAIKDYLEIVQKGIDLVASAAKQYPLLEAGIRMVKALLSKAP